MIPIVKTHVQLSESEMARLREDLRAWAKDPTPIVLGPGIDIQFMPIPNRKRRPFGVIAGLAHRKAS